MADCKRCNGSGVCPRCDGEGVINSGIDIVGGIAIGISTGGMVDTTHKDCPVCGGSGDCPRCEGSGEE